MAEQMEAAHRTALAKGEVGIRDKKPVPTLKDFAELDFFPFVRSTFAAKPKTLAYYGNGVRQLLRFDRLANERLDGLTSDKISDYIAYRQASKGKRRRPLQVASLNRELQVLRRMFHLAEEWGQVEKALPSVKMLPGEKHRERVLTRDEEDLYVRGASTNAMQQFADPALLRDIATILIDCGLRPEEAFRLRAENVTEGKLEIHFGKTDNARRRIPLTPRVKAILDVRLSGVNGSGWVFPADTKSGHIEPSTLKKAHRRAIAEATSILRTETGDCTRELVPFELYTLRHTCLTRWAPHMDPWTLGYLAGHRDMNITKRYVHPQEQTVREAMQRAQSAGCGHTLGHTSVMTENASGKESIVLN